MEAPRSTYLPNDAPWGKYKLGVLKQQCTARNLPVRGKTKQQLQDRLFRYHLARLPEKPRPEPWMFRPFEPSYSDLLNRAQAENLRLVEVRDVTAQVEDGRVRGKAFLIAQEGAPGLFTVTFDNSPTCTCIEYLPQCVHILYLLRYVLNVPEPLRWQRAFLDSEILDIFKVSHPVKALDSPERYTGFPGLCLICFKGQANHLSCLTCDIGLHVPCLFVLTSNRQTPGTHICTVCLDRHEWQNFHSRQERVERRVIEPGRVVAGVDLNPDVSSSSSDASEEDDESFSEEDSSDEDPDEGASRRSEQPNNAPRQTITQRRSPSPPILIKQERSSSPHGLPLPSSPPRRQRQQQQPASSPLRRKQPSRAAKDIGLVRQSLAAAAEAPTRTPRRSQGRTPAPTPASSQSVNVPTQIITPVPIPVIPARALVQIQQLQQPQIRQAVHNLETGRPQSGASSTSRALSSALSRPQDPATRTSATRTRGSAASVQEPVAPAPSAAPQAVEASVPPVVVPAPDPDVPAGSPAPSPATASVSVSISSNMETRKATKLARKLKSLARESAYVREHADRELKRLTKKIKRLEKKAKTLAKRNEASGEK